MHIFICDDQKNDRELLKTYIITYANEKNMDYTLLETSSGEELLTCLRAREEAPAIVFLDIYMSGLSGIDTARQMRKYGFIGGIIFTTISRDHAVEGFDLDADGYLCKPYEYHKFHTFLQRCCHRLEVSYKSITILSDRQSYQILLHRITYIESCPHGCIVHSEKQALKTRISLGEMAARLSSEPCFIRCGRSFIVNMNAAMVNPIHAEFIHMNSGDKILIPVRERTKINNKIAEFYWTKMRETETFEE